MPSAGGGNNNRRPSPSETRLLSGLASTTNSSSSSQTLYHPSVFRYTCRGRLSLDSRNGGNSQYSAGVCRGVQSHLEHIDQWRTMTRDEAVSVFQSKSSDYYYGDSDKDTAINPLDPTAAGPAAPASNGGPSSEGGAHAQALQAVYLSNVLVYPNGDDDEDENNNKKKRDKKIVKKSSSNVPATTTPELEEWRCYGTTEVDLLVLRPDTGGSGSSNNSTKDDDDEADKEETIAAVAPYTAPGMQVRDLTTSTFGKERTRTVRLGILEIVYSTAMDAAEDEEEVEVNQQHRGHPKSHHPSSKDHSGGGPTDHGKKRGRRRHDDEDEDEENLPPLSTPARVYRSAQNVAKHMQTNAKLLYESAQDDFPERTYEAGKRIYEELPHTMDRTVDMMKKMVQFFVGRGDDDDEDNHSGSGGRPRRR